jgi:hypothetical protein
MEYLGERRDNGEVDVGGERAKFELNLGRPNASGTTKPT